MSDPKADAGPALVPAFAPDGSKIQIAPGDAEALARSGGRVATAEDMANHRLEQADARVDAKLGLARYPLALVGMPLNPSMAALQQGGARGLTGGISDVLYKEGAEAFGGAGAGKQFVQQSEDLKTAHGTLNTTGEIAGVVGGALAGSAIGGAGRIGAIAKLLPGVGSSALGGAAEAGIARTLAARFGEGAIARAIASGGSMAARGAIEGGIMSGVQQATDDAFHDKELSAERILAAAGHGAFTGGATGGLLGAGGSLLGSGARALAGGLTRAEGGIARVAGGADDLLARTEAAASKAETAAARAETGAVKAVAKDGFLADVQNEGLYRSLNGTKKDIQAVAKAMHLEDAGEASRTLGKYLSQSGLVAAGDNATDVLGKVSAAKQAAGERIGGILDGSSARVAFRDVIEDAKAVADQASTKFGSVDAADKVQGWAEKLAKSLQASGAIAEDGTISLRDLATQKSSVGKVAYKATAAADTEAGMVFKQFERSLDKRIVDTLEKGTKSQPFGGILREGAGGGGAELRAAYEGAKKDYQMLSLAENVAEHGVGRDAGNQFVGLRGSIGAAAAAAAAGTPLAAIPAALGLKLLEQRGWSMAAAAAGHISEAGVLKGFMNTVDDAVSRASKGIAAPVKAVRAGGKPVAQLTAADAVAKAQKAVDAVSELKLNPAGFAAKLQRDTAAVERVDPDLAASYTVAATRAAAFLSSKVPAPLPSQRLVDPSAKAQLSPADARKFNDYHDAVTDPRGTLAEFSAGRLNPAKVEAFRAVYPRLFEAFQAQTIEHIAKQTAKGKPVPYANRVRLSMVLDAPTDASLTQQGIVFRQNAIQVTAAVSKGGGPGGPPQPGNVNVSAFVKKASSPLDRIEEQ